MLFFILFFLSLGLKGGSFSLFIRKEGVDNPKNENGVGFPTTDPKRKIIVQKHKQRVGNGLNK